MNEFEKQMDNIESFESKIKDSSTQRPRISSENADSLICLVQSTLVISKSKEPSETFRDIRTSTYQMCKAEENANRTTKFLK